MRFQRSWLGGALALAYLVTAICFIPSELRAVGGWINLRGLGVVLITLPSQLTFGFVFEALGWRVNYSELGLMSYVQIGFHVLATALFLYFIGYGIERLARRLLAPGAGTERPPHP